MRYIVGFLIVCGLGVVPLVGCAWDWEPWDRCEGVVCSPDSNVCTVEFCSSATGGCTSDPVEDGKRCDFDGLSGVCVDGVCGENLCTGVVCDDGLECTRDTCDYQDGVCRFTNLCDDHDLCTEDNCNPLDGLCDFRTPVEDGTMCWGDFAGMFPQGTCEAGVCVAPCDPTSEEVSQCPDADWAFCCPGSETCWLDCGSAF